MKKLIIAAAAALVSLGTLQAQTYDVLDQVRNDPRKSWAMEGPHRLDASDLGVMSKAPKGYKPFYISHYGRHGSRTCWSADVYKTIHQVFTEANEKGLLTPAGEEFYKLYEDFYVIPLINAGDLVPLGYEQHKTIAQWTYDQFPEVFKGNKKVRAVVTSSQRSIVSMASFCVSLKGNSPRLDIYQESSHTGMTVAAPTSAPKQLRRYFKGQLDTLKAESWESFATRKVDIDRVLSTFFTNPDFIDNYEGGKTWILDDIYSFIAGHHNYSEPIFDKFISPDDMLAIWEVSNYYSYLCDQTQRWGNIPLLEDVISKADAAISDPSMAANLRFGHDYVAEAFLCLVNANNCGKTLERADDVKYWFQSYNIPMATTILFVFYNNKKGDVIFKVIWNEHEATLPQLTPVEGCYYRWSDFKAWAQRLIAEHPEIDKPEN